MTSTALTYFEMPAKNTDNLVPVVLLLSRVKSIKSVHRGCDVYTLVTD